MTTYGFIGTDGKIESNYLDLDMLSYRNKNGKYILVTENIKTHTIEIKGDEKITIRAAELNDSTRKPSLTLKNENQLQLDVMKKFAEYLKGGDVLMFRTVQDLSPDKDYAALIYNEFMVKDIQLEFLYDPTCDFSIFRKDFINNPSLINGLMPKILTAALSVPVSRKILGITNGGKKTKSQS